MRLIDAAVKDLEMIGDCRTCGNRDPFCDSNPDSCTGYKWRGAPPGSAAEENPPLTLEQLQEMDGEPVWLSGDGLNRYDIFRGERSSGWADFYCGRFSLFCYGKDWLAYRRKPEDGE